jgi:hypothetical protein
MPRECSQFFESLPKHESILGLLFAPLITLLLRTVKQNKKTRKELECGQDRGFIPLNTIPLNRILEMKERGRIGRSTFNMCFSVCTFLFNLLTTIFAVSMQFQTSTMLHKLLE